MSVAALRPFLAVGSVLCLTNISLVSFPLKETTRVLEELLHAAIRLLYKAGATERYEGWTEIVASYRLRRMTPLW